MMHDAERIDAIELIVGQIERERIADPELGRHAKARTLAALRRHGLGGAHRIGRVVDTEIGAALHRRADAEAIDPLPAADLQHALMASTNLGEERPDPRLATVAERNALHERAVSAARVRAPEVALGGAVVRGRGIAHLTVVPL